MKIKMLIMAIAATFGLGLAFAAPSQAQATRTWVSGVGDDANPCSRTAPCKTFAGAISKTAASGEINCLDPGGFGGVTITKAITIYCDSVEGGVLVSGTNGITISAGPTDVIVLDGLDIEGIGTGLNGVNVTSASTVVIRRTLIHQFTQSGVNVAGPAGAKVVVQDCYISNNASGVNVLGTAGAANSAVIDRTTIETHTTGAIVAGAGSTVDLSASSLIGSGQKVKINNGGIVNSYGNNVIRGTSDPLTSTLPLQ